MKKVLMVSFCAFLLAGCVAYRGSHEVVVDDKAMAKVTFENSKARDVFYRKMMKKPKNAFVSRDEGYILGIVYAKKTTFYQTAFYNQQVRMADINGDGKITLKEAESYK